MAVKKKTRSSASNNKSLQSVDDAIATLANAAASTSKAVMDITKNRKNCWLNPNASRKSWQF